MKNVLLISPEPWSHIFVSKHHYAIELCKNGYKVFFLNPPTNTDIQVKKCKEVENLFLVDYRVVFRGQRFLPTFLSRLIDGFVVASIEKKIGVRFDILWNFENSRFFDFRFLPPSVLKIYHQVDLNQRFNLKIAATTADICFCTTDLIAQAIRPFNPKVFKIHHGVAKDAFVVTGFAHDHQKDKMIVASYIGNLDMQFLDLNLLETLVKSFPEVTFQFVGPYSVDKEFYKRIHTYSNCLLAGKVHSSLLPNYLLRSDLLLVLYGQEFHKDQASPHKLMEYLASGKTIVATYTAEYDDKQDLLLMCNRNEDYASLFKYAVSNLETLNSEEFMQKRRAFASAHTYAAQLNKIFSLINKYCATPAIS